MVTPPPNFEVVAYLPHSNSVPELKVWLAERGGRYFVHEVVTRIGLEPLREEEDRDAAMLVVEKALFALQAGVSAENVRHLSEELAFREYRERNG